MAHIGRFHFLMTIFLIFDTALGGKILIIHPLYASSNALTLRSVSESIAEHGHHIDVIKWKDEHTYNFNFHSNITVNTLSIYNGHGEWNLLTNESDSAVKTPSEHCVNFGTTSYDAFSRTISAIYEAYFLLKRQCEILLANRELYEKLEREEYDLAIVDTMYNECGLALAHQLKIPTIGYWAMPFSSLEPEYTTAFLPASHVPAYFSHLGHQMNFFERTYNLIWKIISHGVISMHFYLIDDTVQKYYPGTPQSTDLLKNLNGMLIYADPVLDYPRLLPPTFINIGGVHLRKTKPLPKDIEEWIESSGEHGVVFLSMGFTHDLKILPKKLVNSFIEAFNQLPQKFLIKLEETIDIIDIPLNVKVLRWAPQQDILAHPKVKAFITHCGTHGVLEGAYNGVPMLGMPISQDHGEHCAKIKDRGMAIVLNRNTATTEDIYRNLKEIIANPEYKINAKKISRLMKDVKESPEERLQDFIEYMIRHKGAEHLKLSSRHLNWFQYFSFDSIAFLTCFCFVLAFVLYKFIRTSMRIVLSGSNGILTLVLKFKYIYPLSDIVKQMVMYTSAGVDKKYN